MLQGQECIHIEFTTTEDIDETNEFCSEFDINVLKKLGDRDLIHKYI